MNDWHEAVKGKGASITVQRFDMFTWAIEESRSYNVEELIQHKSGNEMQ